MNPKSYIAFFISIFYHWIYLYDMIRWYDMIHFMIWFGCKMIFSTFLPNSFQSCSYKSFESPFMTILQSIKKTTKVALPHWCCRRILKEHKRKLRKMRRVTVTAQVTLTALAHPNPVLGSKVKKPAQSQSVVPRGRALHQKAKQKLPQRREGTQKVRRMVEVQRRQPVGMKQKSSLQHMKQPRSTLGSCRSCVQTHSGNHVFELTKWIEEWAVRQQSSQLWMPLWVSRLLMLKRLKMQRPPWKTSRQSASSSCRWKRFAGASGPWRVGHLWSRWQMRMVLCVSCWRQAIVWQAAALWRMWWPCKKCWSLLQRSCSMLLVQIDALLHVTWCLKQDPFQIGHKD